MLDILKEVNKEIIIISSNINDTLRKKYKSQYKNIIFINNNSFHDRFIIIDRKRLFISGSSLKDVGKKCFGIIEFDDIDYLNKILKIINL